MKAPKNLYLVCCLIMFCVSVYGQSPRNRGWFFSTSSVKLSSKFLARLEMQVRSSNSFEHFETLLLRAAIGYRVRKSTSVFLGYAFKGDWTHEEAESYFIREHRIFEQFSHNMSIKLTSVTFRLRQEQRFINSIFAQRSRAFLSFQVPLFANADFSKGVYSTIQDEIFINSQHKEKLNNSYFDQNRAIVSLGYRWSKKMDTEIGYMYWLKRGLEGNFSTNVIQLMITTSF